ncbi:MAG: cytochrome P450 [Phycisphaerales bacterium]|nr:cytochrome P450 [Phycisphaerales bacterium]
MRETRLSTPNLGSRSFKADPYPFYARLRETSPVTRVSLPNGAPAWLVVRYDDCVALLKDQTRFVKNPLSVATEGAPARAAWMPGIARSLSQNMLDLDAPAHARLRRVVQKAFTPRLIEGLRSQIQATIDRLLDRFASTREMDLIRDFALPFPVTVISEMLGVDEEDRARFHRWSSVIVAADTSRWHALRAAPSAVAFLRYARRLIRSRRKDPRDDLTSALVAAEDAGDTLSEDETVAMIFLLLVAGHETTVNLIGNGMLTLLEHPAEHASLRRDPGLVPSGLEELLRFEGPLLMATERYTRDDVELAGVPIPRGSLVYPVIASANRDEHQFTHADSLDLAREPNRHVAFGQGAHYCMGASLARLEGKLALGALLTRFPELRLHAPRETLRWRRGLLLRGVENMPVLLR